MSLTTRKRGTNFSKEEELFLLEEIKKFKHIIENKKTDNITCTEKNEAWKKITANFNAGYLESRTIDQIKGKYENLKTKTRKWASNHKKVLKVGGGGCAEAAPLDPVIEGVLNIMNQKTVFVTCEEIWDTSSGRPSSDLFHNLEPETNIVVDENTIENMPIVLSKELTVTQENSSDKEGPPSCVYLSSQVKEAINRDINVGTSKNNWDSYTVPKIPEPINKSLQPKIRDTTFLAKDNFYRKKTFTFLAKESYYRKKTELIETKIAEIKRKSERNEEIEDEDRLFKKRRHEREEEEHKKRMILLDLEIQQTMNNK